MDLERMREKISAHHSGMLKRMLGLNELPEPLLVRYFLIKKLTDRIDAPVSPEALLRIALDCGFNPETMRFKEQEVEKVAIETIVETTTENDTTAEAIVEEPEKMQEGQTVEPSVTKEEVAKPVEEVVEDIAKIRKAAEVVEEVVVDKTPEEELTLGQAVRIFDTALGEIKDGRIVGSRDEGGEFIYSVEVGEETLEFARKDIDTEV